MPKVAAVPPESMVCTITVGWTSSKSPWLLLVPISVWWLAAPDIFGKGCRVNVWGTVVAASAASCICQLRPFHPFPASTNIAAATTKITDAAGTVTPLPLALLLLHCPRHQARVQGAEPGGTLAICISPSLENAGCPIRGARGTGLRTVQGNEQWARKFRFIFLAFLGCVFVRWIKTSWCPRSLKKFLVYESFCWRPRTAAWMA